MKEHEEIADIRTIDEIKADFSSVAANLWSELERIQSPSAPQATGDRSHLPNLDLQGYGAGGCMPDLSPQAAPAMANGRLADNISRGSRIATNERIEQEDRPPRPDEYANKAPSSELTAQLPLLRPDDYANKAPSSELTAQLPLLRPDQSSEKSTHSDFKKPDQSEEKSVHKDFKLEAKDLDPANRLDALLKQTGLRLTTDERTALHQLFNSLSGKTGTLELTNALDMMAKSPRMELAFRSIMQQAGYNISISQEQIGRIGPTTTTLVLGREGKHETLQIQVSVPNPFAFDQSPLPQSFQSSGPSNPFDYLSNVGSSIYDLVNPRRK